jgi:hypothetical protein
MASSATDELNAKAWMALRRGHLSLHMIFDDHEHLSALTLSVDSSANSKAAATTPAREGFLDLPNELQNMIFTSYTKSLAAEAGTVNFEYTISTANTVPAICQINRSTRQSFLGLFYGNTRFKCQMFFLPSWYCLVKPEVFALVNHIQLLSSKFTLCAKPAWISEVNEFSLRLGSSTTIDHKKTAVSIYKHIEGSDGKQDKTIFSLPGDTRRMTKRTKTPLLPEQVNRANVIIAEVRPGINVFSVPGTLCLLLDDSIIFRACLYENYLPRIRDKLSATPNTTDFDRSMDGNDLFWMVLALATWAEGCQDCYFSKVRNKMTK